MKHIILVALAGSVLMATAFAQQSTVKIQAGKTSPTDGKAMFTSYCAPCHGVDGKGNGPVASQLVQKPVDLTLLTKNNGGKFPATHVLASINFGADVPAAHGARDMPVWGPILNAMDNQGTDQNMKALREKNLEAYIESIQVK
jgi:mono/diheme cytochrome c family protein